MGACSIGGLSRSEEGESVHREIPTPTIAPAGVSFRSGSHIKGLGPSQETRPGTPCSHTNLRGRGSGWNISSTCWSCWLQAGTLGLISDVTWYPKHCQVKSQGLFLWVLRRVPNSDHWPSRPWGGAGCCAGDFKGAQQRTVAFKGVS